MRAIDKEILEWCGYCLGALFATLAIFAGFIYLTIELEKWVNAWMPN